MVIPKNAPRNMIWHVTPVGDLREHITENANRGLCWCRPQVERVGIGYVVTHNAADGREAFETGARKPS